jgi:hypothetical protein
VPGRVSGREARDFGGFRVLRWQRRIFRSGRLARLPARRSLLTVLHSLTGGLLSGLDKRAEINELLEELFYDSLISQKAKS